MVKEVILDGLGGKNNEGIHRATAHLDKNLKVNTSIIKRSQSDESLLSLPSTGFRILSYLEYRMQDTECGILASSIADQY